MKRYLLLLLVVLLVFGCAGKRHYSSSLMGYLYPDRQPQVEPSIPSLNVPLKIGIAFVPQQRVSGSAHFWSWSGRIPNSVPLSERERVELLDEVAAAFEAKDFIESIEVIPSAYLTTEGGFDNLGQIRNMYMLDVIALVSYDQVQNIDEGFMSLSYWTIVGTYVVKGEKNSTNTLIDAAVFHIPSRSLLFRAPGTSFIEGKATPVNLEEQLRKDSTEGFALAGESLIANLQVQLAEFQEKVKQQPERYQVTYREGHGGSLPPWMALIVAAIGGVAGILSWRKRS